MRGVETTTGSDLRGASLLAPVHRLFLALDAALRPGLAADESPLALSGALANLMLIVSCVSGVVLLCWYSSSVHSAYASLAPEALGLLGGLTRSAHRYSSDACVLFASLHGLKMLAAGRLAGPRWLPWVTGLLLMPAIIGVGWLGYWLVWDERARQVALGTARLLDGLPIFTEPLSRSFLTDDSINSLLFFMVFFAHMLVPLIVGIGVWIHILRLNRARFLTGRRLTLVSLATLLAACLLVPATSAAPARMALNPAAFTFDAWYLWPLALTDRLSGGAVFGLLLLAALFFYPLPWALRRRRAATAEVVESKCNACETCVRDCPYAAISLVPRTDGRDAPARALVDPARCVSCGICAGSCDSGAIGLPTRPVVEARHRLDAWLAESPGAPIAFLCAASAGGSVTFDAASGHSADLPGWRVVGVPCIGEVHALTVERALRHGASRILLVGCPPESCGFREGPETAAGRLSGVRKPALRLSSETEDRVVRMALDAREGRRLATEAARLLKASGVAEAAPADTNAATGGRARRLATAVALCAVFGALTVAASDAPYVTGSDPTPELFVSFNHPGQTGENCRTLSAEELAALPPHMRQPRVCDRGRAPVRLRVTVDGAVRVEGAHAPAGLSRDGNSVAVERLALSPGEHEVGVEIGDGFDPQHFEHRDRRRVMATPGTRTVVLFDKVTGFGWHEGTQRP